MRICLAATCLAVLTATPSVAAAGPELPSRTYSPDELWTIISPAMGADVHNQPSVVNGALLLAGNGRFELWDISNPYEPLALSTFASEHDVDEAESHTITALKTADGHYRVATISGKGVDLWDLTDVEAPAHLSHVTLEGIDYGDNTNAVWGVAWQGDVLFVGGTNTGLHVVDTADPTAPNVLTRIPTSELGGVSAGPLFAIGNLLVVTTPKSHGGIATLDISAPAAPALLDFVIPEDDSYIGWFYGTSAYLLSPFRTYDVTSDPRDIRLLGSAKTPKSEYVSFADGHVFLGSLRPNSGVFKALLGDDPDVFEIIGHATGRVAEDDIRVLLLDDQFSLPIGNLVVLSDDEISVGSVLAVHDTQRDTVPPAVLYVNPPEGATAQPVTTRIGLSFSDQLDLRSVDASTVIVRPLDGGAAVTGHWGLNHTVLGFWPAQLLKPDTTYEIVVPVGGVQDLAGNAVAVEHRSVFSTGTSVAAPSCSIEARPPTEIGAAATFEAGDAGPGASYRWSYDDGSAEITGATRAEAHTYTAAGRYRVTLSVTVAGATRTCSGLHIVHRPLPVTPPTHASPILVDEVRGRIWVARPDAGAVMSFDRASLDDPHEVPVGKDPRSVAQAPDGSIWVTSRASDEVHIIDAESRSVQATIAVRHGGMPFGIAMAPDGQRAYVTLEQTGQLLVLDVAARAIVATVDLAPDAVVPPKVRGIAVTPDGGKVLVTRFISPAERAEVYVVDTAKLAVERRIDLALDPTPDAADGGRGVPNYLTWVTISPDGSQAWLPSKKDNVLRGLVRDGEALTTTNTVRTIVSRVDLAERTEALSGRLDLDDHNLAYAVVFSPLGDLAFVASLGTNKVDVIEVESGRSVGGFATGLAPRGLALATDGVLYVHELMDRTVSAYDVSRWLRGDDSIALPLGTVLAPSPEPLEPAVFRGKRIFHNADSRLMSQDGYISCATCHLDGGDDGQVWDFTDRGEGLRNTTDLRGRAGTGHGPVHWSGNFDEIQDFEHDIRGPFGGAGLMTDEDFESDGRNAPLGTAKAGVSERLDDLAAYVASLDRFPRSPHRNADGSLTDDALHGLRVYRTLDCADCHSGPGLTDSAADVRHDVGTLRPTSGQRLGGPLDGLDTPTLRGLWASPPYLHDGSAETVAETLRIEGHGDAQGLSERDEAWLVALLLQIEGEDLDALEALPEPPDDPEPGPEPLPDAGGDDSAAATAPPASRGDSDGCAGGGGSVPVPVPWLVLALLGWIGVTRRPGARQLPHAPKGRLINEP